MYEKYSGNLDVTAIYVEALMNLKAWQLWDKNTATRAPADDNTYLSRLWKMHLQAVTRQGAQHYATFTVTHLSCRHSQKRLYQ